MCVSRMCAFPRQGTRPSSTAILNHHRTIFHHRPAGVAVMYKMTFKDRADKILFIVWHPVMLCICFFLIAISSLKMIGFVLIRHK